MNDLNTINRQIAEAEQQLKELEKKKVPLCAKIEDLKNQKCQIAANFPSNESPRKPCQLSEDEKISLFRSLFRGREDVFPRRFESPKTGKSGYQPACKNEWIRGLCGKPKVKCADCGKRNFIPVSKETIKSHLLGRQVNSRSKKEYVMGVYPLLPDETCWFLAADFDKTTWQDDVSAFMETCQSHDVPVALERSRSGKGGHIWIFFSEPVPASLARKLGAFMLTQTMEQRPEIGLDSYDRFFPSQDTLPQGGFGNLIALPFQHIPRQSGNTVFLDDSFEPYKDQWGFLASIKRISLPEIEAIVSKAAAHGGIIGIKMVSTDEEDDRPWEAPPSGRKKETPITGSLPGFVKIILGNQVYIEKENLPPALINRLIRLAAFQNPEFYKAQAMRFPTFNKPRVVHCCEDFSRHIGLPIGCLDEVVELLNSLNVKIILTDERFAGKWISARFKGLLRPEQKQAVDALLAHDIGVLSASTAFGKTVIAIYLLATRQVNTLILVHRKQLLDQWRSRLLDFLDIDPEDIGQIGGGKRNPKGKIDIAMIQSLSKKGIVDDIVENYGHIIVDECHHISARSFEIAARQSKAKFITGLSATVVRKDGHHPIIFMNCGPLRYKMDDRKQAKIRPFKHSVVVRQTSFQLSSSLLSKEYIAIHEIYAELMADENRNDMIVKDILDSVRENRCPVVLTERVAHLQILANRLSSLVQNVLVFKGGMGTKQRKNLQDKMAVASDNDDRVIIATGRYLGEGFDDARIDTLFLTLPVSWKGVLNQYAGRLHRLHDMKKEVIIYDYADLNVKMLARMYGRRINGYKSIGYEIHD